MRELTQLLEEIHRYFPEWADRPEIEGPAVEADHNSYLAGGYSEEFGYRVCADRPALFPPPDGDPDTGRLWSVQITGLHPGYPECPRPDDRDPSSRGRDAVKGARRAPASANYARNGLFEPQGLAQPIHVIRVGGRSRGRKAHDGASSRLALLWARWSARRRGLDH